MGDLRPWHQRRTGARRGRGQGGAGRPRRTASSEAAAIVLTLDRVDALADAILIARRSKRIALQAVLIGMGLSFVAMAAAAAGLLPPAAGGVVQEVIDVLAIGIENDHTASDATNAKVVRITKTVVATSHADPGPADMGTRTIETLTVIVQSAVFLMGEMLGGFAAEFEKVAAVTVDADFDRADLYLGDPSAWV